MRVRPVAALATAALALALGLAYFWSVSLDDVVLLAPRPTEIVYDRNGAFLTQIGHAMSDGRIEYGYWPLEKLPDRFVRATLALEDRRFYRHPGVDPRAIARALWKNLRRIRIAEGASTIPMQVVRLQDHSSRSFIGKLREAFVGAALIRRYGHDAVLAHYLRLAPYGAGSHGAAHAARFYFNKPLDDLSWAETALLAAIPQSPGRMNITRESGLRLAAKRAQRALDTLEQDGSLDPAQAALARRQLTEMRPRSVPQRPGDLHLALRYEKLIRNGEVIPTSNLDPRIHATIDLSLQADLTRLARRYLIGFRAAGAKQLALMVAKRGDNALLAEIGSADYRDASAGAIDYTRTPRSPGSTLKPFVYALAFERAALKATDLLADAPEGASGVGNADGAYLGLMLPRQALANSRNVPATNLLRRVGLGPNFEFLHDLGLHDLEAPPDSFGVSMAIGSLPTTLENLMRAYAAIADDGKLSGLSYAQEQKPWPPRRVMSVDTARLITSFLSDPQARLPTFPRYGPLEYPFAVAVKTGTSQGYRDAWTMAFSQKYIVGVWLGRADAGTMKELGGAASSARLAHAALAYLHGAKVGDIASQGFAPPPDRQPIDLCVTPIGFSGGAPTVSRENAADCAETIREWVKPDDDATIRQAMALRVAVANDDTPLAIATPEHNAHIWMNRDLPAAMNLLALKLRPGIDVEQIVWHIDGAPFKTAGAGETVFWPMRSGVHHIEARLALRRGASRPVKVTIE
jgi:penicillin-binding protein 1C